MKRNFNKLSKTAQETIIGMITHCLETGSCMGMEEGWNEKIDKHGSPIKTSKKSWRKEIEKFVDSCNP